MKRANIGWARTLEQAGVHVVYGLLGLKTHSKTGMVIRKEGDGVRRYLHLATGNYNPITANFYEDVGLFTCDEVLAADVTDLFNYLTGYSTMNHYRKLLVAPVNLRQPPWISHPSRNGARKEQTSRLYHHQGQFHRGYGNDPIII